MRARLGSDGRDLAGVLRSLRRCPTACSALAAGPSNWQDHDSEEWSPRSRRSRKHPDLQVFMARGGIEPPTPRFSVKELEAMVWPWLQGLS